MKKTAWFVPVIFAGVVVSIGFAQRESSTGMAERICRDEVGRRMNLSADNVQLNLRRFDGGVYSFNWWADRSSRNRPGGTCEVDRNGRIVSFRDTGGTTGGYDDGRGGTARPYTGNYPKVKVDTSGRGNFNSRYTNARVTRGYVDTEGRPSVGFGGENDFRITFFGEIERVNSDRDFTMQITSSSRGDASGRAQVRLNEDRNEVEMLAVNGRMAGEDFSGSFSR